MDTATAASVLRQFNEKAGRLERSSFGELLEQQDLGWSFKKVGEDWHVEWRVPDEEATDAFLLTLRMFYQSVDAISVKKLAELYPTLPVSDDLQKRVRHGLAQWRGYLDTNSCLISGKEQLPRRKVFEMVLWGDRAHMDAEKKVEFDRWVADPGLRAFMETEFAEVVEVIFKWVLWFRDANEEALRQLGTQAS